MELIVSIILIVVMYVIYKAPEWKANNRLSPPGKKTDWGAMSYDRTVKGMSNRDIYIKQNNGGYDIPNQSKKTGSGEDLRKRNSHGS